MLTGFIRKGGIAATALYIGIHAVSASAWNDHVFNACNSASAVEGSTESILCHAYIEGFLDGAIVTDAAVVESVTSKPSESSDYLKRVYSSRAGTVRGRLPATALAHFCLPEETPRADVVKIIAGAMQSTSGKEQDSSIAVYTILRSEYPCQD